jgi:ABC-type multidrug transport system fused ATPase/permease subunit
MSLLTNDVNAAEAAYQDHILLLVQSLMQAVSAAIFMLLLKWDLALLIIASGIAPLIINAIFAGRLRKIGLEFQEKLAGLSERLSDLLAGFQIVRTFNLGDWILARFAKSNQEVLQVGLKRVQIEASLAAANDFGGLFMLISFVVGAAMVLDGRTTLGTLFGLIQLNNPIQNCFYLLGSTIANIQGALAAGDRLLAVLDSAPEPERYPAQSRAPAPAGPQDSVLEFNAVDFRYADGRPVLKDFSCRVEPGQLAAFVGPSGSGKSTLFRLLMGHYPVRSGAISLFGKPLSDYTLRELRDLSAFVPQDAYLYAGTVLENIRFGKLGAAEADVIAAAQASYAHDFIMELPEGYNTQVGERGARLSGGQRQRIAIARALLKNAPILLLDEATSALDSESEEWVQQALNVLMRGRTTLVIAHRLSTIEKADIIYVVENGQVVEQGKHPQLIRQAGLYRTLYELQFKDIDQVSGLLAATS